MPYLIDGHNLIGQMRSIQLHDPDDEAKLVMILQRFALRRRVRVMVIFDRGGYGNRTLGGTGVHVRFARSPSNADALIVEQLRRVPAPHELVVVSSDRAITTVAAEVGARVIGAREFAHILAEMDAPAADAGEHAIAHAHVRADELAEWLEMFGVDPAEASKTVELHAKPMPAEPSKRRKRPSSAPDVFVPPPHWFDEDDPTPVSANPTPRDADGTVRPSRHGPKPRATTGEPLFKPPPPVHPDEIAEWMRFFGADEQE